MKILHIAAIDDNKCAGVPVAVPGHIIAQQKTEDVSFINIKNQDIKGVKNRIPYGESFEKPDIAVFHEVYYTGFLKIAKQLKKQGIPYIIVPHGCLTKDAQSKKALKKKLANALLFNKFIEGADSIQFLSERERTETKGFNCENFIIPNGIIMPKKKKEGFSENGVKLSFIGRLDPFHKGIDIMLEAVAKIRDFMDAHCVKIDIYGPDENGRQAEINELIKKYGVADIVSLKDEVVDKKKEKVLLSADIFIQTSRFEGMPMGILEALSYGIPCLLTRGTALGSKVEAVAAGWRAEDNSDSVAETIKRAVLDRKNWKIFSDNAVCLAKHEFGTDRIAMLEINKYKKIIN